MLLHRSLTTSPHLSFEFFPPKTPEMERKLWDAVKQLEPLKPDFVSVTYGAGGSTRERTHHTVVRIRQETSLEPAAHLTCVGANRGELDDAARRPARRERRLRAAGGRLRPRRRPRRGLAPGRRLRDQRRRISRDPSRG